MSPHYEGIQSPYIQEKLKQTSWEDRHYIDDLLRLEQFARKPHNSWASAIIFYNLRRMYQEEWVALLEEVDPQRALQEKERISLEIEQVQRLSIEFKENAEKSRRSWHKAGGQE